ncbi:MAG: GNAT family N-acetyltransferase [Fimbriimonadaceae bacterium]|nr:GNAT family N-acetyltransferase [Fimbriimonadaceae bacterium]
MSFVIRPAVSPAERQACLDLRRTVFIDEQGVREEDEWDDLDASTEPFLALAPQPVGTARLLLLGGGIARAQRVAVLPPWRGVGVGTALMAALESRAREHGCHELIVLAQVAALPFYARCGYHPEGALVDDVGIPHRWARKLLD